jgi:hypothetical protein
MNGRRYKNYRFVSRLFASDLFNEAERELLHDAAEGLLLMSSPDDPELEELERNVDVTLGLMVDERRIHETTAGEMKARIASCGPRGIASAAGMGTSKPRRPSAERKPLSERR